MPRWASTAILCFSVAAVLLFGAHLVGVQRDFIQTMFGSGDASGAHDGRYNVLLLGGDSGADRWGLRPDSITIASIDAETGRSVLISLPRNMQNFPFAKGSVMREQFPDGFDCEHCMLNGVNTWAMDNKELFGKAKHPGIDATIMAVEGITGLKINYWAMVNLKGFRDLVDAVGGVTLNVRSRIPIGGLGSDVYDYIEPGRQKLTGFQTQWYARARDGSDDYSRMARQKCVMGAMLDQLDPTPVLRNFQKIAKASSAMVQTSIPASEVDRFISLALKAKGQKISTLSVVPPLFDTYEPDAKLIKAEGRRGDRHRRGQRPQEGRADGRRRADDASDAKAGKTEEAQAPGRPAGHRRLDRLAARRVRRQRVPGPRQRPADRTTCWLRCERQRSLEASTDRSAGARSSARCAGGFEHASLALAGTRPPRWSRVRTIGRCGI